MNTYVLSNAALSLIRYRRHHMTKESFLLCISITAVITVILFAYMAVKKVQLRKAMGFSNKAEYEEYKRDCKYNFRNRFCISDTWVINEFSYKFYPSDDMISVERSDYALGKDNQLYRITVNYRGGKDVFNVATSKEREELVRNIEEFIRCRDQGKLFVPDNFYM